MQLSMRPTKRFLLSSEVEDVLGIFRASIEKGEHRGEVLGRHVTLKVSQEERHFWSPWLQIELRESEESGVSNAVARFSPHPSIWTGFALSHLGLVTLATIAACFGFAQMSVGYEATAFWAVPICLVLMLLLFIASQVGQWLAREQIEFLEASMTSLLQDFVTTDSSK